MEQGWLKLWRKSMDSQVFQNEGLWKVWTWCLMRANHAEAWFPLETGRGTTEVHLRPGQFVFGRKVAARELKMPESTVWGRMRKLEAMGNISIKSDSHYSIITIRNWLKYQLPKNEIRQATDNQPTSNRQPTDTNNNVKNNKNDENYTSKVPPCPHQKIVDLYHEMLPDLPKVRSWTRQRRSLLEARWKEDSEHQTLNWWKDYFKMVRCSPWLLGQIKPKDGGAPFRANLEWLVRPSNFVNVLEGKYDQAFKGAGQGASGGPSPDMPENVVNYLRKGGKCGSTLLRERSERERHNKWLAEMVDIWRKGFGLDINERPHRQDSSTSNRSWIPSAILDYAEGKIDFDEVKRKMLGHIKKLEKDTEGKAELGEEGYILKKLKKFLEDFERHCSEMPS